MVLQRNKPVPIWGWATKGEQVTIIIGTEKCTTISDASGIWRASLNAKPAGGPYVINIKTNKDSITLKNILFGDVWICSGQSNMAFEVKKVNNAAQEINDAIYPSIRLFQVGRKGSQKLELDVPSGKWEECSPVAVKDFSAVALFFGRDLIQHTNIPIGLIDVSWGGSTIEAWMSPEMLKNYPQMQGRIQAIQADPQYIQNKVKEIKVAEQKWLYKFHTETGNIDSAANLIRQPEADNWVPVNLPGYLDDQKIPVKPGISWYRRSFTIPDGTAANSWELSLGQISDVSLIYLNGHKVAESLSRYVENKYAIPASYLKNGQNELLIYAINESGLTGFSGLSKLSVNDLTSQTSVPLAGQWYFKQQTIHVGSSLLGLRPSVSFENNDYTLLYNAMIAPLTHANVAGAIWYQGETNANKPDQYENLLTDLIKGWRASWNFSDMPFYIVQLPNYNGFAEKQKAFAWPRLQEVQKKVAFSQLNSGLAVTYDLGERANIHPKNKQDVGKRLALVVRKNFYKESSLVCYGPIFKKLRNQKDSLIISFEHSSSDLVNSIHSSTLNNFEVAGNDLVFYPAMANIKGNEVVVFSNQVQQPVYVRYAFTSDPMSVNFYNKAGLPAVPFRTDNRKDW